MKITRLIVFLDILLLGGCESIIVPVTYSALYFHERIKKLTHKENINGDAQNDDVYAIAEAATNIEIYKDKVPKDEAGDRADICPIDYDGKK